MRIVDDSMKPVWIQSIRSTPFSSPTIVGSAVASTVWLRENMNIASMSPMKRRTMLPVVGRAATARRATASGPEAESEESSAVVLLMDVSLRGRR